MVNNAKLIRLATDANLGKEIYEDSQSFCALYRMWLHGTQLNCIHHNIIYIEVAIREHEGYTVAIGAKFR